MNDLDFDSIEIPTDDIESLDLGPEFPNMEISDNEAQILNSNNSVSDKHFLKAEKKASERIANINGKIKLLAGFHEYGDEIFKIDRAIKKVDKLSDRIVRLSSKSGTIDKRQRSFTIKEEIIRLKFNRNQTILNNEFKADYINDDKEKLHQLKEKIDQGTDYREYKTNLKKLKKAEKDLYGKKLKKSDVKKIDEAIQERERIIAGAKNIGIIDGKREYRKEFRNVMNQLREVDKKIIGKRNTKEVYERLKQKSCYLIGGTELVLPREIVELHQGILPNKGESR